MPANNPVQDIFAEITTVHRVPLCGSFTGDEQATNRYICSMKKAGILGGGQLGRMLLQTAANYPVITHVMENDENCPAAHLCHHFTKGDINNFDAVYNFGKNLDCLTIEIESVNTEALEKLQQEGVKIYPQPQALKTIKNKILQKQFYADNQIPSSPFRITQNREELAHHKDFLPAVHKSATDGYDGRGVQLIKSFEELGNGFDVPSVLEKMVDVKKEIAISIAVSNTGETAIYPPVDMVFDPKLNLLSHQLAPAELDEKIFWKLEAVAHTTVKRLNSAGIFAVELFVDHSGNVWVNETAPRVHNSGHHTIEASYSSQFDMLWRIMLNYPLGNTQPILPAAIVNVLGAPGFTGPVEYEGLQEILSMPNVFVHLYGKAVTKPGRKMGHITVLSNDKQELLFRVNKIKNTLRVISKG